MSLSELNIDVAIEQLLATAKPDYPEDHKAAMRVPHGGSSCSSCKYLADNKTDCTNEYFQKWHGSAVIPAPIDEFCSDWYEPNEDIEAYGTSEGVRKEWETRIRHAHGIDVDIFNRYSRPNPKAISVRTFLDHDPPPEAERVELAKKFLGAEKVGQEDVDIDKLTPLQTTVFKDKVEGIRTVGMHRTPIDVFRYKGKTYVIDGHHRLAVWALDQHDTIPANIYERHKEKDLEAGEMNAEALFRGIPIEGFTGPGEEAIRAAMSRVPPELLTNVKLVKATPELQPKHGRYDPETHTVNINPLIFNLRQRFGRGQGWIYHTELCMCHEIGHSIYYFLPEKMKDQWREISGWMVGTQDGQAPPYEETRPGWPPTTSKWTHREGAKFTRKYAKKNDDEDFADSFAFCILGKPHQMAPAKREFIDGIIKDRVKKYPTSGVQGPDKPYGERDLNAGGPGSGCNPEVADPRCGRPTISGPPGKNPFRGTRGHDMLEHLKDGKWHNLETIPQGKRQSALFWAMRPALRKMGYNIKVRQGMVRLVKNDKAQSEKPQKQEPQTSTQNPNQFKLFPANSSSQEREQHLATTNIASVSSNDRGGASISKVVTFTDGSYAIFKPSDGQWAGMGQYSAGFGTEREVGAWEVAKIVGADDITAATVRRTVKGEDGSLIEFQKGSVASRFEGNEKFDGAKDAARAAAFDYVIGNTDRHGGNWLVEESKDQNPEHYKLHLIDHNLTFPDLVDDNWDKVRSKFVTYESTQESHHDSESGWPAVAESPKDLAKPYIAKKDNILSTLKKLGLPQAAISGVSNRIEKLSKAGTWKGLGF